MNITWLLITEASGKTHQLFNKKHQQFSNPCLAVSPVLNYYIILFNPNQAPSPPLLRLKPNFKFSNFTLDFAPLSYHQSSCKMVFSFTAISHTLSFVLSVGCVSDTWLNQHQIILAEGMTLLGQRQRIVYYSKQQ